MTRRGGHRRHDGDGRSGDRDDEGPALRDILAGALQARSAPVQAEAAVLAALAQAPDSVEARLAAYRFYFYDHRLAEALPHADAIVQAMARRLNVATDWRLVGPEDAPFAALDEAPGLYLQALLAWGYASLRIGAEADGVAALEKVVALDPADRFGARRVLAVVAAHAADAAAED
ncbi:hypothetical protein [Rhodoplanes azumiensis]|uniref:Tetratricopeptide repeat protein n=1 Tax=Rhodoplanes azumiensis TaxID=1897628 RepID=A0ABW5AJT8_9BRAD